MPLTAGITYYIAVDGYNGASGSYTIFEDFNRLYERSSRFTGTGMSDAVTVFRQAVAPGTQIARTAFSPSSGDKTETYQLPPITTATS